jgi:MtN3 and saliva related transmembrane protein
VNAATTVELLGYVAAALTTTSFVPQAVRTFRTRSTEGISLGMYGILTTGIALWVVYGLAIGSTPILVANGVTLVLAATILVLALHSRRATPRPTTDADLALPAAPGLARAR